MLTEPIAGAWTYCRGPLTQSLNKVMPSLTNSSNSEAAALPVRGAMFINTVSTRW